jgi:hypothetical protein
VEPISATWTQISTSVDASLALIGLRQEKAEVRELGKVGGGL